jgi:hypothetical protein
MYLEPKDIIILSSFFNYSSSMFFHISIRVISTFMFYEPTCYLVLPTALNTCRRFYEPRHILAYILPESATSI